MGLPSIMYDHHVYKLSFRLNLILLREFALGITFVLYSPLSPLLSIPCKRTYHFSFHFFQIWSLFASYSWLSWYYVAPCCTPPSVHQCFRTSSSSRNCRISALSIICTLIPFIHRQIGDCRIPPGDDLRSAGGCTFSILKLCCSISTLSFSMDHRS